MQKLQNRAARVITKSSYDVSSSILLEKLHWDNFVVRRLWRRLSNVGEAVPQNGGKIGREKGYNFI
jgi:hypothetical protein